jgi:hypothetical protein
MNNFKNTLKSNRGSSLVLYIIVITVIVFMGTIMTDVGYMIFETWTLDKELEKSLKRSFYMVDDKELLYRVLKDDIALKDTLGNNLVVNISEDKKTITVEVTKIFEFTFLKIFGLEKNALSNNKTIKLTNSYVEDDVFPIGITNKEIDFSKTYTYRLNKGSTKDEENEVIIIKDDFLKEDNKFMLLVKKGDIVTKKENNIIYDRLNNYLISMKKSKKSEDDFNKTFYAGTLNNILKIPIVKIGDDNNYSIDSFTAFLVENYEDNEDSGILTGSFVKVITESSNLSDSIEDFGVYGYQIFDN